MNGKEIDGRAIRVDESRGPPAREKRGDSQVLGNTISPPSTTLFVGNLPFSTTEEELSEIFSQWGVKSARIPTFYDSRRSKGFGYVEFESLEGAREALEAMQGIDMEGRFIRLDFSEPKEQLVARGGEDSRGFGGRGGRGGRGRGRF